MLKYLQEYGIDLSFFFAGLFGSLMSVSKAKKKTPFENITTLIGGAGCANYLTPIIVAFIPVLDTAMLGVAFLVGFGGFKLAEIILEKFTKTINNGDKSANPDIE